MNLGLLFVLLTLSLIQVPILLGRYSEETHMVINPTFQIAWTRAHEDKEGCHFHRKGKLHVWDSGWSLDTAEYPKLPGLPSPCSTSALWWSLPSTPLRQGWFLKPISKPQPFTYVSLPLNFVQISKLSLLQSHGMCLDQPLSPKLITEFLCCFPVLLN